ncbi:MAG: penicillin-binding protein 2 [Gammaproteobacteria bacterium]|nr:penicillin-binding protein 2 [Gammaproteobacteria bacterium]
MNKFEPKLFQLRRWFLLGLVLLAAAGLVWRALYLQWMNKEFLLNQGDARHLRVIELAATRGIIFDRNGEPLAISTPVDSIWVNPKAYLGQVKPKSEAALSGLLEIKKDELRRRIKARGSREFVYLRRHVAPELADKVAALEVPGVHLQREYRRYYPTSEVTGHVVGFTDVDDGGQEGMELALDSQLRGVNGAKRVLKDRLGEVVEDVEHIADPQPGHDVTLSIDRRVQYLVYRELKAAVQANDARSASAVLLDASSGEVLAMVNQPTFNPNNRDTLKSDYYRNRAVTDVFEPGSTVKPFTVAAALEAGKIKANTLINTGPGYLQLGRYTIRDAVNYGTIDVTTILQKSSNIGASKIALTMRPEQLWKGFSRVGFGMRSSSQFPGEVEGKVGDYSHWHDVQQASFSYGYGLSVTALQLARAYSVLANDGMLKPVSFEKLERTSEGVQVMDAKVAVQVRSMLESVVADAGTARAARVDGYRIAGKTGTVHRMDNNGYADDRYSSLFVGMAPASRPRLVMAIVIHDPQRGEYHGGTVAAPVFARVMTGALRLLDIPPDNLPAPELRQAATESAPAFGSGLIKTAAVGGVH